MFSLYVFPGPCKLFVSMQNDTLVIVTSKLLYFNISENSNGVLERSQKHTHVTVRHF